MKRSVIKETTGNAIGSQFIHQVRIKKLGLLSFKLSMINKNHQCLFVQFLRAKHFATAYTPIAHLELTWNTITICQCR